MIDTYKMMDELKKYISIFNEKHKRIKIEDFRENFTMKSIIVRTKIDGDELNIEIDLNVLGVYSGTFSTVGLDWIIIWELRRYILKKYELEEGSFYNGIEKKYVC